MEKGPKNIYEIQRVKHVNIFPYTIGLNMSQTGEYRMIALILIRHVPFFRLFACERKISSLSMIFTGVANLVIVVI